MSWQRLSVRGKTGSPESLHEGVPSHLISPLVYWLQGQFGYRAKTGMRVGLMNNVAMGARLPARPGLRASGLQDEIIGICLDDSEAFLNTIDCTLHLGRSPSDLDSILTLGGSMWTVASDGLSLQRRVEEASARSAEDAISTGNQAGSELESAWAAAYGRSPNPSDAWDHAIKAIESVLIPIVAPKQSKPQLGHVIGQLRANPQGWRFVLPGSADDYSPAPLLSLLDGIWPNPDRHASGSSRQPTQQESEAAVHAALLIVQWSRLPGFLATK